METKADAIPVRFAYLAAETDEKIRRATERQGQYLVAVLAGDDLSDFKPKTVDSCKKHGFTDDSGVTLRGLYVSAPELNKHIAHPSIKAALQKLIDAGPQDVYQDKWPHWDLVGGAHKRGEISLKIEPRGGFGSNVVSVTIAWREQQ